ncbi:hypothetical protein GMD62_00590 [Pseudoflavonifractor sp. BIOML-A14]|nr:hypothetical protein [Pseudoflavonifractor sp. BIOML-A14]
MFRQTVRRAMETGRPYRHLRRALASLLAACMLLTLLPVSAFAEGGAENPEPMTVTAFDPLEETVAAQTVPCGTAREALDLPDTLRATVYATAPDAAPAVIEGVTWEPDRAYEGAAGVYAFTASAERYICAEGVDWPVITVTVEEAPAPQPDEVDALCAAIDALPTVEELYENAPGDADPEFDGWVTETKARLEEVSALWEKFLTLSEDGAAMERITEARAEKLEALHNLAERLREMEPNADAPTPTVSGINIFANGAELKIVAGTTEGYTNILYDKNNDHTIGDTEYLKIGTAEPTAAGYDLSSYYIYGGSLDADVDGATKITMTGGEISHLYGGGRASSADADVKGTELDLSGGLVRSNVYGGGEARSSGKTASVTGDTSVTLSGDVAVDLYVYGGGWAGSSSQDNVTGAATVSLSGNAKVSGGVYGGGYISGSGTSTAGSKTVTVGGGVKIGGGTAKGVVINGGTGPVATGVDSFAIDPDLTGADGSVNVQLPAGYDITSNPTIATGAVEADLAKITLVGGGATGKEAYFENNEIKVREKPAAPVPTVSGYNIFANGAEIKIVAGETEGYTNILYDKNSDRTIGDTEYLKIGNTEPTAGGYNLSAYFIYGGSRDADVDGVTKITMTGGKVYDIYGGGRALSADVDVKGTELNLSGGLVRGYVYGGGEAWATSKTASVTGDTSITLSGDVAVDFSVYGGGRANTGGISTVGSATVEMTGGTAVAVYGGGWADSSSQDNVTGAATVSLSGNAEVSGEVYGGGYTVSGGTSTVNSKTVTVGGGVKIGGSTAKGIAINGGTASVSNGVGSFVIANDLTESASVNVNLPAGYDITSNPTIATGAVEADLAKIKLVGGGAEGKEAYFESGAIKVREKSTAPAWPASGEGTEQSPYVIETYEQLAAFAANVSGTGEYAGAAKDFSGKYIKLADTFPTDSGTLTAAIGGSVDTPFKGHFDGGGKTVALNINESDGDYQGLFGYVDEGGVVENVTVTGAVTGKSHVGGVAGQNIGTVQNCVNKAAITGNDNHVGGVVGYNRNIMSGCHNTGEVKGLHNVGGVVGQVDSRSSELAVQNCYNTGTVIGTGNNIGGVAGYIRSSDTVQNCYNTGKVSGSGNSVGGVVGLVGNFTSSETGTVLNCYNTGAVIGSYQVGGVVGVIAGGKLENCLSLGLTVTATHSSQTTVGRVAGDNYSGTTLSGNRARGDMEVYKNTTEAVTPTSAADGIHGADVAVNNTVALRDVFSGWDTGIWTVPTGNLVPGCDLPTLKGVTQTHAPTLPGEAPAPIPTIDQENKKLYANGAPLLLMEGTDKTEEKIRTVVYLDKGTIGELDGEDVIIDLDGDETAYNSTEAGNYIYDWFFYGGSRDVPIACDTNITMLGGKVHSLRGGGYEKAATVTGSTHITMTGGTVLWGFYGGGDYGEVSCDAHITVAGTAEVASHIYGSGLGGAVRGNTFITIGGEALLRGNVFGGASSGSSTVTVSGSAKIGSDYAGIVINGGTKNVSNGVDGFVLDGALTGADASVNVNLPAGYDASSQPTIATGAVKSDLAKIKLVGDGAAGKTTYFEDGEIKVRLKSTDATLTSLSYTVGGGAETAVPGFNSGTETYTVILPAGTAPTAAVALIGAKRGSAASVTGNNGVTLSGGAGTATLTVTAEDGTTTKTYTVNFVTTPNPPAATAAVIDYKNETISFDGALEMNTVENFGGASVSAGGSITDYIGQTLYIRVRAAGEVPVSAATAISIPARPQAPGEPAVVAGTNVLTVTAVPGVEYTVDDWSTGNTTGAFTGLQPGTVYSLKARVAATESSFKSGELSKNARTLTVLTAPTGTEQGKGSVSADKTVAAVDQPVTYTVTFQGGYTPTLTLTDNNNTLSEPDKGENNTWTYTYTVHKNDKTVGAAVTFAERKVESVSYSGDPITLFADSEHNATADALGAYLGENVPVTPVYDNGTTGEAVTASYALKSGSTWNAKGGTYTYTATVSSKTCEVTVTVKPVNAAIGAVSAITKAKTDAGYATHAALGLPTNATVTYTGDGYATRTGNLPFSWSEIPQDFGKTAVSHDFTGTVALPAWATYTANTVTATVTITNKTPLTQEQMSLTMGGWTYGEPASTPHGAVTIDGHVVQDHITYQYSADSGATWADTLPASGVNTAKAGAYQVRMNYEGDAYTGSKTVSFTIAQKPVTLGVGALTASKVYDGDTTAALTGVPVVNGKLEGDTVTAEGGVGTYQSADVGTNITVTVTGCSLTGADAGNYSTTGTVSGLTGTITQADGTKAPGYQAALDALQKVHIVTNVTPTLADVTLPAGWAFTGITTERLTASDTNEGKQPFPVRYTPANANYAPVTLTGDNALFPISTVALQVDGGLDMRTIANIDGTLTLSPVALKVTGAALPASGDYAISNMEWSSSVERIATVTGSVAASGMSATITAKAKGVTMVGVAYRNGGGMLGYVLVKVMDNRTDSANTVEDITNITDTLDKLIDPQSPSETDKKAVDAVADEVTKLPDEAKKALTVDDVKALDDLKQAVGKNVQTGDNLNITIEKDAEDQAPAPSNVEVVGAAIACGVDKGNVVVTVKPVQPTGSETKLELKMELTVNGTKEELAAPMFFQMDVPDGIDLDHLKLYHVKDDGTKTELSYERTPNSRTISFKMLSFSSVQFVVPAGGTSGGTTGGGGGGTTAYTLTATAGEGGKISPSGKVRVSRNSDKTFTVTPNDGYVIADVLVDGKSVGAVGSYTFEKITREHTIAASFQAEDQCPAWNPFTDVKEGAWYYDSVKYVYEHGLMNGTSKTTFSPDLSTTRGMIVTILWRLEKEPESGADMAFGDVKAGSYYFDAIRWAVEHQIVKGFTATTFGPDNTITRQELAAILYRYAQYKGMDVSASDDLVAFTDRPDAWAENAVKWAVGAGVISGKGGGILDPKGQATRAQVAAMLMRFISLAAN